MVRLMIPAEVAATSELARASEDFPGRFCARPTQYQRKEDKHAER